MSLLEISGLTKRFGRVWALRGIDLALEPGQILGLLGPNGAGKSTLLGLLAGVLRPTAGRITILGHSPGIETKRRLAYLPEVDHIQTFMTDQRAIRFIATFFDDFDPKRAEVLLETLKVPAGRPFGSLSKGQRASFKLALTLARGASLLLLDEPLAGIDLVTRDRILNAILAEYRLEEQSVILATHEIGEAETLFDQVVFLNEGKITLTGSAEELRAQRGQSIEDIYRAEYR